MREAAFFLIQILNLTVLKKQGQKLCTSTKGKPIQTKRFLTFSVSLLCGFILKFARKKSINSSMSSLRKGAPLENGLSDLKSNCLRSAITVLTKENKTLLESYKIIKSNQHLDHLFVSRKYFLFTRMLM